MTERGVRRRLFSAIIAVPALVVAGCAGNTSDGSAPHRTATSTPANGAASGLPYYSVAPPLPGASSGNAVELAIPVGTGALLAAAKGRTDDVPAREYLGMNPQSPLHLARDAGTGTLWAAGEVRARPRFMRAGVSLNDAGSYDLFERKPGEVWTASDIGPAGQPPGFLCHVGLPNDVIALWRWPLCLSGVS